MFDWLLALVDTAFKKNTWYLVGTTYCVLMETYKRDIVMCNVVPPRCIQIVSVLTIHLLSTGLSTFLTLGFLVQIYISWTKHIVHNNINPALLSKLMQSTEFYIDLLKTINVLFETVFSYASFLL